MKFRRANLAILLFCAAITPTWAQGSAPEAGFWDGLASNLGFGGPDPDLGFTIPSEPLLEVIVVRPDPERPGLRYAVDCSHTKPSQREAFRRIPWLAPVDCLEDGDLRETRALLGGGGVVRPFGTPMYGELRRAMAFGTTPAVAVGQRLGLTETARRVFSVTEPDRAWPAQSPRGLLLNGALGSPSAMRGVDGGRVAGFFDAWLLRMKDWRVDGSPMDTGVQETWRNHQARWVDHFSGKTRGDWDLGRDAWHKLLLAAVERPGVAALLTPRDPFEDAFLVTDHAKWGPAYKDFGRTPCLKIWPVEPARP